MPRKTKTKRANKTVLLVVEGATEKNYFSDVQRLNRIPGITILPKLAKHSDVGSVLKVALDEQASKAYDSIWCVFDRDTIADGMSATLERQFRKAEKNGIHFADSMPAFEVWFLLHYAVPKPYYNSQDNVITELRKYVPEYSKNEKRLLPYGLTEKLNRLQEIAMFNSQKLSVRNKDRSDSKSTMCNVYKLFEELDPLKDNR